MSATYDETLPTAKDRMRLLLGDTDVLPVENALLSDETYGALLAQHPEAEATARAAEGLALRYAQEPDSVSIDGDSYSWRDRVKSWMELAKRLRASASSVAATVDKRGFVVSVTRDGDPERGEYVRPEGIYWPDL